MCVIGSLVGKVESYRLPTGDIAAKYQLKLIEVVLRDGERMLGFETVTIDDHTWMAKNCRDYLKPGGEVVVDGTLDTTVDFGLSHRGTMNITAKLVVITGS